MTVSVSKTGTGILVVLRMNEAAVDAFTRWWSADAHWEVADKMFSRGE
ncbi:hypothetical protein [Rhodococcus rhodochrous]|nr:hypothetical protein [Rhodococcus rhodochrous]MCD2099954.1 hypothetical protein [Rhodococcus rhodochrous]MCD2122885.1 hypothetical protein [Rhodococcus rhodochrous]MCQ4137196.1 hypothetical protein [Rhodococcus rhodochrous]MDJ0018279.1 hypothetical protein [Rhodococcus rhodochrous]